MRSGDDVNSWTEQENRVVVESYFEMLRNEVRGYDYKKSASRKKVQEITGRSKGSVEFKFGNISAILVGLGLRRIEGYKPFSNYQDDLKKCVEEWLSANIDFWNEIKVESGSDANTSDTQKMSGSEVNVNEADSNFWSYLNRVAERSFGGSEVAVRPNYFKDDDFWPVGPSSPAADEVLNWFRRSVEDGGNICFVFLIGGPGNGKSFLVSRLVRDFEEIETRTENLAYRDYKFRTATSDLLLINDATIPPEKNKIEASGFSASSSKSLGSDDSSAALIDDINRCSEQNFHLLANVNRGIIFEELNLVSEDSFGRSVLQWISQSEMEIEKFGDGASELIDSAFLRAIRLKRPSGPDVDLVAVYMDVCSIFEERPSCEIDFETDGWKADVYSVSVMSKRKKLQAANVVALQVFNEFFEKFETLKSEFDESLNPFAANICSLSSPDIRRNLLTILRASEIASARKMTYREFWAAISLALIGDLPERGQPVSAEWLRSVLEKFEYDSGGKKQLELKLISFGKLAALRLHQTLFRARPLKTGFELGSPSMSPVVQMTKIVDPIRDSRPGRRDGKDDGWASPVLEAFESLSLGEPPLKSLLKDADANDPISHYVTGFDLRLDELFMEAQHSSDLKDNRKREITSWYGDYMLRMYAVANGIPAFSTELEVWTRIWASSSSGKDVLQEYQKPFKALLLPETNHDKVSSNLILPIYDSRTIPIGEGTDEPKLVVGISISDWHIDFECNGDQVFLKLKGEGEKSLKIDLDFPMLREGMACSNGFPGLTELNHIAAPRLERFRSAILKTHNRGFRVANGTQTSEIEFS